MGILFFLHDVQEQEAGNENKCLLMFLSWKKFFNTSIFNLADCSVPNEKELKLVLFLRNRVSPESLILYMYLCRYFMMLEINIVTLKPKKCFFHSRQKC